MGASAGRSPRSRPRRHQISRWPPSSQWPSGGRSSGQPLTASGRSAGSSTITGRFTRSARRSASGPMPGASNAVRDSSRCRKMARSSWRPWVRTWRNRWADCTLTASIGAIRLSSSRSSSVNRPPRLLIAWHTPMAWSSTISGTVRLVRACEHVDEPADQPRVVGGVVGQVGAAGQEHLDRVAPVPQRHVVGGDPFRVVDAECRLLEHELRPFGVIQHETRGLDVEQFADRPDQGGQRLLVIRGRRHRPADLHQRVDPAFLGFDPHRPPLPRQRLGAS